MLIALLLRSPGRPMQLLLLSGLSKLLPLLRWRLAFALDLLSLYDSISDQGNPNAAKEQIHYWLLRRSNSAFRYLLHSRRHIALVLAAKDALLPTKPVD